ncbi:MAG: NfeD family protein [Pirellulales bacterium]|nr:NfeD family protein [Pirellulales bacterium]
MDLLFLICAVGGGTVLVLQFLLMLVGLGGQDMDADHDFGGDSDVGDLHAGHVDASADAGHDAHQIEHHGTIGIFKVLSFRAIVAALAFFGLGGMAARSAQCSEIATLAIAVGCAVAAVYLVYWLMKLLYSLNAEGTVHIQQTLGKFGTVYLRIPPSDTGSGKIQINLQNRTMEYLATTAGPEIPTGATVEVVGIVSPTTLAVARADGAGKSLS